MRILKNIFNLVKQNRLIILILLLASVLRLVGVKPGYNQYHSDEPVIYSGAVNMIKNSNVFPGYYYYGAVPITINSLVFRTVFIPLSWARYYAENILNIIDGKIHLPINKLEKKSVFQTEILGERDVNAIFWARYVTAIFGIGCVYLTYLLGNNVFNKKIGFLAALLLTFNFKHVVNSHIGLPDIYNSFFLLLSMLFSFRLWQNPSRKYYLLAGIFVGISFSVKYQFYAVFPFFLAHLFIALKDKKDFFRKIFDPYFIAGCFAIPLMFLLLNPYYFINLKEAMYQNSLDVRRYALGVNEINLFPLSFLAHFDYGYFQILLMIVGLVLLTLKDVKKMFFIFIPYAIFIFIFFYYSRGGFFVRSAIGTTPIAMLLVAYAITIIADFFKTRISKYIFLPLMAVFVIVVIIVPARNSILNAVGYSQKWTFDSMHDWMENNVPLDQKIAVDAFDVAEFPKKLDYLTLDFDYFYSKAELEEMGASWAVYNLFKTWKPYYFWMNFNFKNVTHYWNKPVKTMQNMYPALVVGEMARYRVFDAVKPWQAPDMNLIITKFPKWNEKNFKEIVRFTSKEDFNEWTLIDELGNTLPNFQFASDCYDDTACIVFLPGGVRYPTIRYSSGFIEIKSGYLYKIEGYLKTEKNLVDTKREGFIRVDFYKGSENIEFAGMASSVSSRVYGTTDWNLKKIIDRAPEGAKYIVVSFQVYNTNLTKIWFDKVTVKESIEPVENDINDEKPYYLNTPLNTDLMFPNSHGNL